MKNRLLASIHMDFVLEDGVQKVRLHGHRFDDTIHLEWNATDQQALRFKIEDIKFPALLKFKRNSAPKAPVDDEDRIMSWTDEPPCA